MPFQSKLLVGNAGWQPVTFEMPRKSRLKSVIVQFESVAINHYIFGVIGKITSYPTTALHRICYRVYENISAVGKSQWDGKMDIDMEIDDGIVTIFELSAQLGTFITIYYEVPV